MATASVSSVQSSSTLFSNVTSLTDPLERITALQGGLERFLQEANEAVEVRGGCFSSSRSLGSLYFKRLRESREKILEVLHRTPQIGITRFPNVRFGEAWADWDRLARLGEGEEYKAFDAKDPKIEKALNDMWKVVLAIDSFFIGIEVTPHGPCF